MKLLLVDEEPEQLDLLKIIVAKGGHDAVLATSGAEALEILTRETIDCVLLDIMLPVMDGIEVMQRIKHNTATAHIPVILVTALDCNHQVLDGYEHGADHYLCKPVQHAQLLKAIQLVTAQRHKESEHD